MLKIRFIPIFEDKKFIESVREYEDIWNKDGEKIVETFKDITGLSFVESRIGAVIYDNKSWSGRDPKDIMRLRYSYSTPAKKATLIHELGHRLMFNFNEKPGELSSHQLLNLFLYDCWVDLYGEEFAKKALDMEKGFGDKYIECWEWALNFSKEERSEKFKSLF